MTTNDAIYYMKTCSNYTAGLEPPGSRLVAVAMLHVTNNW